MYKKITTKLYKSIIVASHITVTNLLLPHCSKSDLYLKGLAKAGVKGTLSRTGISVMTSAHRLRGAIVGCIIPFFLTLLSPVEARNMGNLKPDTPHAVTKPFFCLSVVLIKPVR